MSLLRNETSAGHPAAQTPERSWEPDLGAAVRPEGVRFRAWAPRAHSLGMGVIADVVYNHTGPEGSYLQEYSPDYYNGTCRTEWGHTIDYDGPGADHGRHWIFAGRAMRRCTAAAENL